MEKRLFLAFFLSFALLFVYNKIFMPEQKPKFNTSVKTVVTKKNPVKNYNTLSKNSNSNNQIQNNDTNNTATNSQSEKSVISENENNNINNIPIEESLPNNIKNLSSPAIITSSISTDLFNIELTNAGAAIKSIKLKKFSKIKDKDKNLDLLNPDIILPKQPLPLTVQLSKNGEIANAAFELVTDKPLFKSYRYITKGYYVKNNKTYKSMLPLGLEIIKKFTFNKNAYSIKLNIEIHNNGKEKIDKLNYIDISNGKIRFVGGLMLNWLPGLTYENKETQIYRYYKDDMKTYSTSLDGNPDKNGIITNYEKISEMDWISISSHYFLTLISLKDIKTNGIKLISNKKNMGVSIISPIIYFNKNIFKTSFDIYIGPKDYYNLKDTMKDIKAEEILNYGWFESLSLILLNVLNLFYKMVPNYGVAIILLTILVNIILYPLKAKSLKSMEQMKQLQPKLKELKEKYADDKTKIQQETMRLYKEHKINPMGGCLPIFIQLPIFIGLYRMLQYAIELRGAEFLYLHDLSASDPTKVLPIFMGITMFVQQKLTPMNPEQAKTMMFLPIIFTIMFMGLPSGLILYWTTFNLISVAQQLIQNRISSTKNKI